MTLNIQITVPEDAISADVAGGYLGRALAAIGFVRNVAPAVQPPVDNEHVADGATSFSQADIAANAAPVAEKPARRTRAKAEPATTPETPVDDAAVEAQDAADELAEVETTRDDKAPLTTEDVKAAMGEYVKKFGMAATQEDGPKIFVEALGAPPAGQDYWKLSLLADAGQDVLNKAAVTWKKAAELNPLRRAAV